MKFCTVRELRLHASRVLRSARRQRVVITVRGHPTAVLAPISEGDFDGLSLDLYPEVKRSLRRAETDIGLGKGLSLQELKRRLRKRA